MLWGRSVNTSLLEEGRQSYHSITPNRRFAGPSTRAHVYVQKPELEQKQHGQWCSRVVFLAGSATDVKLPPFVVFTGVPGGPLSQEVFNQRFGASTVEHTVQKMHSV
ncbi:hypothetical protein PHMEG_0006491 [Phytophthora megakarya]|uniref:Uncharacterized protein n=1 Tax=Phytophthora megakarya TaxID=4795 RepID=A0A225WNP9_9STRA|nr:hypothetical protein PHMEG_0006491 [Phytophthora megakarya]